MRQSPDYTHSTAPNRRFPDLITLRMVKAVLAGNQPPYSAAELGALAEHCTAQEDAAQKVERRMRKSEAALLLESHVGQQYEAIVTGSSDSGLWYASSRRRPKADSSPGRVGSRWASRSASSWCRRTWSADSSTSWSTIEWPSQRTHPSTLRLQVLRPGASTIRSVGFDEAGNAVLRTGSRDRLDRASLVFIYTFDAAPSRRRRRAGDIHGRFADVRGRTNVETADLGLAFQVVLRWR